MGNMKVFLFTCIIHYYYCVANKKYFNQYEILIKQEYFNDVKSQLESQGFTYLQQIAGVSIFQGNDGYNERSSKENVAKLKQILADKVLDIEQAYYIDPDLHSVLGEDYETERAEDDDERSFDDFDDDFDRSMYLTCSPYYDTGHGIDAVWENFDGYNITVAVVDIGVSVKHDELSAKIRIAHNFETNDENVEPEDYGIQYSRLTNHGNSAASVIGAVKDNKLCSAGVAYNASIAAFKIGSVSNTGDLKISVININAALAYKYNEIDIYSNSWDLGRRGFRNCGLSASAVLKAGVQKGRRGSGSIYMIATGKIGNCFSNSIYTIAVNSIGTNGSVPSGINRSSATLVSAFGQANNRTSKYMITASQRPDIKCDKNFKGSSSATAIVAGICALILQAKPTLTWRDIQHILVQSSDAVELNNHTTNGAGRTYHDVFGFGIVNASKAIEIAKPWVMVDKQMNITKEFERFNASHFIAEIQCNNGCVQAIEHVQVTFNFVTKEAVAIKLISPSGSTSNLTLCNDLTPSSWKHADDAGTLLSVNFWDEQSNGTWLLLTEKCTETVARKNEAAVKEPVINAVRLRIYGTGVETRNDDTYDQRKHVKPAVIIIVAILVIILAIVPIVMIVRYCAHKCTVTQPTQNQDQGHAMLHMTCYDTNTDEETNTSV